MMGNDTGLGLDTTGLDAVYNQDQAGTDFTDELLPTDSGNPDLGGDLAAVVWNFDDAGIIQNCGIYYASDFVPIVAQSCEFGGYGGDQAGLAVLYVNALGGAIIGGPTFIRGDANADNAVEIADAITILTLLFGMPPPVIACLDALDVNDDGMVDISVAVADIVRNAVP